jgi:sugar phosphate isomerase/epimerase
MKLSITVAGAKALPSAFVVFRGFETSIPKAARLGFEGVELALKRADEINPVKLQQMLDDNNLEVSCISTGQIFADGGLMLTHDDKSKREQVISIFKELIDLGAEFGRLVNIGRVRGLIGERSRLHVENMFIETARHLCDYAAQKNVTLVLEPINRYETDFINNIEEGVRLVKKISRPNMMLMPDIFHMNIEDRKIGQALSENIDYIKYIHLADSNRLAPGNGHTNFESIFIHLQKSGYDGWVCAEILPLPTPDEAARQAAEYLLPVIEDYSKEYSLKRLL